MKVWIAAAAVMLTVAGCSGGGDGGRSVPAAPSTSSTVSSSVASPSSSALTYPDKFVEFAATQQVGTAYPVMLDQVSVAEVQDKGKGYCDLLTGENVGAYGMVRTVVMRQTQGAESDVDALLRRAVESYCPEKSMYLP